MSQAGVRTCKAFSLASPVVSTVWGNEGCDALSPVLEICFFTLYLTLFLQSSSFLVSDTELAELYQGPAIHHLFKQLWHGAP